MRQIDILPGAKADLTALRQSDPDALATIVAFLQEADADPALIERSASKGDHSIGTHRISVKPWVKARRSNDNLFRYRILDTPATSYRVVYGFDWRARRIGILAVVHREDFDYGLSGTLANRIQNDWRTATGGRDT
jgi:mRNA-degrading endonuclease RelE of RelBE toxin-antitoxin system